MEPSAPIRTTEQIAVGAAVSARSSYSRSWAGGFEVAEVLDDGYRLRRVSDGALLPGVMQFDDVQDKARA